MPRSLIAVTMPRSASAIIAMLIVSMPFAVTAQTPISITLPTSTTCGVNPIAKVNLNGKTAAGGLVVQLSSSIPSVASVPTSVTVAGGASSADFVVTCTQVAQSMAVNISATANGATQTALINVLPPILSGIVVGKHTGGTSVSGSVHLTGPAPPSGQIVTLLESSNFLGPPQTVTVAAGNTSATFSIATQSVPQPMTATMTATAGVTKSIDITVMPPTPTALAIRKGDLFLPAVTVIGGTIRQALVTIGNIAPLAGLVVQLSSSNSAVASVSATVTITSGQTSRTFEITTVPVAQSGAVTITAAVGAISKSAVITVVPPELVTFGLVASSVVGGQSTEARLQLNGPAPAGGTSVQFTSTNSSIAFVKATRIVAQGETDLRFTITTSPVGVSTSLSISAKVGNITIPAQLTVSHP